MRYSVTTPPDPTTPLVDWEMMRAHLRLADDRQRLLVMSYVAEATEYAEDAMQCSLVPRTITAVYDVGDEIVLARGPIISVESVEDSAGNAVGYARRDVGNRTTLTVTGSTSFPLTVVYRTGFASVPASIAGTIRVHAASKYLVRESHVINGSVADVHKLDAFYAARSRGAPIA